MAELFAGTSGFAYKEWKGSFYPEDLSDRMMLEFYSSRLPSVEVNYTFRRLPSEKTIERWKSQAAEGFKITLKASQRITHWRRLKDAGDDVAEFMKRAALLGDRLGAVLFQLPPTMGYERETLEGFLSVLPPATYAMEFRHPSWNSDEVRTILSEAGVAVCAADTESTPVDVVPVTAPHVYLRLRKEEYGEEEVESWSRKVGALLQEGHDVYCYFKHEGGGLAARYATDLLSARVPSS